MRKRASSGGDVLLKEGVTSLTPLQASHSPREKVFSSKVSQAEEKSDRTVDSGQRCPQNDAAPTRSEIVTEKGRDKDKGSAGDGTTRQKRKSVCVVAPSDMKLRRSNSEKLPPDELKAARESTVSRRSTIAAVAR